MKNITKQDLMDACDAVLPSLPKGLMWKEGGAVVEIIREVVAALPDEEPTWQGQTKYDR